MNSAQDLKSSQPQTTTKTINGERYVYISETQLARMEKLVTQYELMSQQLDNANAQIKKDNELSAKDAEILASSKRETLAEHNRAESESKRADSAEAANVQLKDAFDKLNVALTETKKERDDARASLKKSRKLNVVLAVISAVAGAIIFH